MALIGQIQKRCVFLAVFLISAFADDCVDKAFDYIVVGAGSAGAVVATRLSEDSDVTVLLLEAGGEPNPISDIPLFAYETLKLDMNWNYMSVHQEDCCKYFTQQTVPIPRGKVLGGTSSLNFMTYTRGNKQDYDGWAKLGNDGWAFDDVLPYFHKIENYKSQQDGGKGEDKTRIVDSDKRNSCLLSNAKNNKTCGPINIEYPAYRTPVADAFLEAAREMKYPTLEFNTGHQVGFMYPPVNTINGSRCSTYIGYLKPNMGRKNFRVETYSFVTKILFDEEKKAQGVEYEKNGVKCTARSKREVIVSGGSINSPQLLMLSGIGPKEELEKFQIPIISDLSGVGRNLQDHAVVATCASTMAERVGLNFIRHNTTENMELWQRLKTGPMTCPASVEGLALLATKLSDDPEWPDLEIYLINDNVRRIMEPYLTSIFLYFLPEYEEDMLTLLPMILRPKSRGAVSLQSSNPHDHPLIDPKWLSHPDDKKLLVEGTRIGRRILETQAFKNFGTQVVLRGICPSCVHLWFNDDEYLKCIVDHVSSHGYHFTSTCKMGPRTDSSAVVDERLRVYGVKRLRVADASIMPNIVAAHPNAACMMIGEKAADLIKEDWKWVKKH